VGSLEKVRLGCAAAIELAKVGEDWLGDLDRLFGINSAIAPNGRPSARPRSAQKICDGVGKSVEPSGVLAALGGRRIGRFEFVGRRWKGDLQPVLEARRTRAATWEMARPSRARTGLGSKTHSAPTVTTWPLK
jgi:hypothetical protein